MCYYGFYSFLKIDRVVTVHCFLANLEVLKQLGEKKTMNC